MTQEVWPELKKTARTRIARLILKIFLSLCVILPSAAMVGIVYEAMNAQADNKQFPPPGTLVDVGGHRLHAQIIGDGPNTVVLDAGLGGTSLDWSLITSEVSKFARVVVYDRAGMGWSDLGPMPRTSDRIADELWTLIDGLGIQEPVTLVGHSFGGYNVRMAQRQRPTQVAAIMLIDASHEDQTRRLPSLGWKWELRDRYQSKVYGWLAHIGVIRFLIDRRGPKILPTDMQKLPSEVIERILAFTARPQTFQTIYSENRNLEKSGNMLLSGNTSLGDLPLAVLTAGKNFEPDAWPEGAPLEEAERVWYELQNEEAALSSRSTHQIVEDSAHYIHIDNPELVTSALRHLLDQISSTDVK